MKTAIRSALLTSTLVVPLAACGAGPGTDVSTVTLFGYANVLNSCQYATPSVLVTQTSDTIHDSTSDGCAFTGKGDCSLRDAVLFANRRSAVCGASRNTHINLPPGIYTLSLPGDRALDIEGETFIHGQGTDATVIQGGLFPAHGVFLIFGLPVGIDSVIRVEKTGNLFIGDVTIRYGNSQDDGSGIANKGQLRLVNCNVTDNRAASTGGGISGGTLELYETTVSNNRAGGDGGGIAAPFVTLTQGTVTGNTAASGGGILNNGLAMLNDTQIVGNTSRIRGGGIHNAPFATLNVYATTIDGNVVSGDGGGISNARNGRVNLQSSRVSNNKATGGNGGGIDNVYDGLEVLNPKVGSIVRLIDSAVVGNEAVKDDAGKNGTGGGIRNVTSQAPPGINYPRPWASMSLRNSVVEGNQALSAGGILNDGATSKLSLEKTEVSGNTAQFWVGGVANGGELDVQNSTISGNGAPNGAGGLYNVHIATLLNCTISGNSVNAGGAGGIFNSSGGTKGQVTLVNSTVFSNSTGIANFTGALEFTVRNSIVAGSTKGPNCEGVVSQDYNLESGLDCGFRKAHDKQNLDPGLGPLAVNAPGLRETHALLPGSPAIDAGGDGNNNCPGIDERGVLRPQGSACDIGAYELVP